MGKELEMNIYDWDSLRYICEEFPSSRKGVLKDRLKKLILGQKNEGIREGRQEELKKQLCWFRGMERLDFQDASRLIELLIEKRESIEKRLKVLEV